MYTKITDDKKLKKKNSCFYFFPCLAFVQPTRMYQVWIPLPFARDLIKCDLRAEPSQLRPSSKTLSKVSGDFPQGNFQQWHSLHLYFSAEEVTDQRSSPHPLPTPAPQEENLEREQASAMLIPKLPASGLGPTFSFYFMLRSSIHLIIYLFFQNV